MLFFYLGFGMLLPLTMIIFGKRFTNNPPKYINAVFGYRTSKSMKSKAAWVFAHKYFGKLWLNIGIGLGLMSLITILLFSNAEEEVQGKAVYVITMMQLVALLAPIIPTEIRLSQLFDGDGRLRETITHDEEDE